jgi:cell division septal protein FtsQ
MVIFAKLREWSLGFAVGCGVVVLLAMGFRLLIVSDFLKLKDVIVETGERLDRQEILPLIDLRQGDSLITINLGRIRRKIQGHPLVEQASVERMFPHSLRIRIRERQPVARVLLDKRAFLVDAKGSLFAPSTRESYVEWPPLKGLRKTDFEQRPEVCLRILKKGTELIGILKSWREWRIREVGLDLDRGIRLILRDLPFHVLLGFDHLEKRVHRLAKILNHLKREGLQDQVQWIDLRYSNKAFVKFTR